MVFAVDRHHGSACPSVDALELHATNENLGFVTRLLREWRDGSNRFDRPGECLFLATDDGRVVGICGVNVDPYTPDPAVGRLRHLYVHPEHRRRGIATALVHECRDVASGRFRRLRLRTDSTAAASSYRAMGFVDVTEPDATHAWPR